MPLDWTDKQDGQDFVFAKDVNSLAAAIIDNESAISDLRESVEEMPINGIEGAEVGDIIRVSAVDADGKPTAWEAETPIIDQEDVDDANTKLVTGQAVFWAAVDPLINMPLNNVYGAVGDTLIVKTVDGDGKPTSYELAQPSGGINISNAHVGDLVRVKSVDASGNPTEYEPYTPPALLADVEYETNEKFLGKTVYVKNATVRMATGAEGRYTNVISVPNIEMLISGTMFVVLSPQGNTYSVPYYDGTNETYVSFSARQTNQDVRVICGVPKGSLMGGMPGYAILKYTKTT